MKLAGIVHSVFFAVFLIGLSMRWKILTITGITGPILFYLGFWVFYQYRLPLENREEGQETFQQGIFFAILYAVISQSAATMVGFAK